MGALLCRTMACLRGVNDIALEFGSSDLGSRLGRGQCLEQDFLLSQYIFPLSCILDEFRPRLPAPNCMLDVTSNQLPCLPVYVVFFGGNIFYFNICSNPVKLIWAFFSISDRLFCSPCMFAQNYPIRVTINFRDIAELLRFSRFLS